MDFQRYLVVEENCVCLRPEGKSTLRDVLHAVEQLAIYCRENGVTRALVDTRRAIQEVATGLDVFQFGTGIAQCWPVRTRLVVICLPESLDSARFAQTVAQNRGLSFGLYDDEDKARNWLNRSSIAPSAQAGAHSIDVFTDNS